MIDYKSFDKVIEYSLIFCLIIMFMFLISTIFYDLEVEKPYPKTVKCYDRFENEIIGSKCIECYSKNLLGQEITSSEKEC